MTKNKINLISELLFLVSIILFVIAGFCFDESNAIILIIFYILIMICVFTALILQIEVVYQKSLGNRASGKIRNKTGKKNREN